MTNLPFNPSSLEIKDGLHFAAFSSKPEDDTKPLAEYVVARQFSTLAAVIEWTLNSLSKEMVTNYPNMTFGRDYTIRVFNSTSHLL